MGKGTDNTPQVKFITGFSIFALVETMAYSACGVQRVGLYCHLLDHGVAALGNPWQSQRSRVSSW